MKQKYVCFTNIDEYKREEWPTDFVFPPQVGNYVQSDSGKWLKVVSITHCYRKDTFHDLDVTGPYVKIELHRGS